MSSRDDKPICFLYPFTIIAHPRPTLKDETERYFKYLPPTKDASIKKFSPGSSTPIVWFQFNDACEQEKIKKIFFDDFSIFHFQKNSEGMKRKRHRDSPLQCH